MFEFHPANPHDHFFRRTFDVLPNARALLKSQLPAELVAKLDLQSIQPAKETFLTATDNESRLDLLFTARLLDGTSLLKLQFLNFCRDGKKVIPKTMH